MKRPNICRPVSLFRCGQGQSPCSRRIPVPTTPGPFLADNLDPSAPQRKSAFLKVFDAGRGETLAAGRVRPALTNLGRKKPRGLSQTSMGKAPGCRWRRRVCGGGPWIGVQFHARWMEQGHGDNRGQSWDAKDLLDDVFAPIESDGAGLVEVQVRLQKAFLALLRAEDRDMRDAARRHSVFAVTRAEAGLDQEGEKQTVRSLAPRVARESRGVRRGVRAAARRLARAERWLYGAVLGFLSQLPLSRQRLAIKCPEGVEVMACVGQS